MNFWRTDFFIASFFNLVRKRGRVLKYGPVNFVKCSYHNNSMMKKIILYNMEGKKNLHDKNRLFDKANGIYMFDKTLRQWNLSLVTVMGETLGDPKRTKRGNDTHISKQPSNDFVTRYKTFTCIRHRYTD